MNIIIFEVIFGHDFVSSTIMMLFDVLKNLKRSLKVVSVDEQLTIKNVER